MTKPNKKKQEIETAVVEPKPTSKAFREKVEIFSQDQVIQVNVNKKDVQLIKKGLVKKTNADNQT